MSAPRVLLAKPGLDGHDRGVKVVAMALRDAGAEVIYLGFRRSPDAIARAAADEDVDVIGISVLSGAHLALAGDLLAAMAARGVENIPLVVGGTISPEDAALLRSAGVAEVVPVGSTIGDAVATVMALATRMAGAT
jgi:methylmalonyl-CoA mutase C-terminal domain/subunit